MNVRFAAKSDIDALGKLHHQTWMETYDGLIDPGYLRKLSPEKSAAMLEKTPMENTLVLESDDGLFGFSTFDKSRDDDFTGGEIIAMYILQQAQGKGCGRKLMEKTEEELKNRGYDRFATWVLSTNERSIGFYKAMGYREDGAKKPLKVALNGACQMRMVKDARLEKDDSL